MDVLLPVGTLVRATSVFDSDHETLPTFALYLDPEWQPAWASDRIDWPDRGLPANREQAAAQIERVFTRAKRRDRRGRLPTRPRPNRPPSWPAWRPSPSSRQTRPFRG